MFTLQRVKFKGDLYVNFQFEIRLLVSIRDAYIITDSVESYTAAFWHLVRRKFPIRIIIDANGDFSGKTMM